MNPSLTDVDVREMLIQHILTGGDLCRSLRGRLPPDNNIAHEL